MSNRGNVVGLGDQWASSSSPYPGMGRRKISLQVKVAVGIFFLAAILGYLIVRINPLYIAALVSLPILLAGVLYGLRYQRLYPIFILIAAAFFPFSLPTGTASRLVDSLVLTIVFVGLWILKMIVLDKKISIEPVLVNKLLLLFILSTLISLVWGIIFRDVLVVTWRSFFLVQIASTIVMVMLPGAFLLVAHLISNVKLLKVMVILMLVAGGLGLLNSFGLFRLPINTGGLFTMWVIALATGIAIFNRGLHWAIRGSLLILAVAWVYYRFGLNISWVAGWLPAMAAISILLFMRSKKFLFLFIVVVVVLVAIKSDYFTGAFIQERGESGFTRLTAWNTNWRVTGKHLLFGTGPAGYAAYYMSYFPTEAMATHSNYIDILAQTGIIGLGLFMAFFAGLAWNGYKLCMQLKGRGDFIEGLANAAFAGTLGCILAMAFGDWVVPFAYTQTIAGYDYAVYCWLFMGTILVIRRLTNNNLIPQQNG